MLGVVLALQEIQETTPPQAVLVGVVMHGKHRWPTAGRQNFIGMRRSAGRRPQGTVAAVFLDQEKFVLRAAAVDVHETAFLLEQIDLFRRRQDKALQGKGEFGPGAIRFGDEHADLQVGYRNNLHGASFATGL